MTMPGWLKELALSSAGVLPCSEPPHESEISVAPTPAAVLSAASRWRNEDESASTSTMRQFWQIAWEVSMSRDISTAHPPASSASLQAASLPSLLHSASVVSLDPSVCGKGRFLVSPVSLSFSKQSLTAPPVHLDSSGSPNSLL